MCNRPKLKLFIPFIKTEKMSLLITYIVYLFLLLIFLPWYNDRHFSYFTASKVCDLPIEITLNNNIIKSNDNMNVLGVCFDSKLSWSLHIAKTIIKANTALHAIRLIKKYFTGPEILQVLTSNFFSILYYISKIWHLPSLKPELKQQLLSASAKALKMSQNNPDPILKYSRKTCKRATPSQIMLYKYSIILHKLYNTQIRTMDWIELNFHQTLTSR